MGMIELFRIVFMAGITLWIIRKYLNGLLSQKRNGSLLNIVLWIVYFIYQLLLESCRSGSIVLVVLNVLLIFLICHTGYYGQIRTKALYVILLCVILPVVEMVAFYALQNILPVQSHALQSFGSMLTKLLLIIPVVMFGSKFQEGEKKNLPSKYVGVLLLVSASEVVIAYHIILSDIDGENTSSIVSFVLLLVINCMIFQLYQNLYENMEIKRENAIFLQQFNLISKHEDEKEKIRQEKREFYHNLVNFCIGLKANVKEGKVEQAIDAIDMIMEQGTDKNDAISNCGNDLIDSLINYKYKIAKQHDIKFETNIQVPNKLPIDYGDLSIVLGNMLDNAIEAAKKCTMERVVFVSVGIKHEELIIVVRNTYVQMPKLNKRGDFITNKNNQEEHGYGIHSIRKIADKYEGSSLFQVKGDFFEAIVILRFFATQSDK